MFISKCRIIILLVFMLIPFHAFAEIISVEAIGYGDDEVTALEDAFYRAVQQAVGISVSATVYVENGELIEEKILTRSRGFIEGYDVFIPFDGEKIVIDADVNTDNIMKEMEVYGEEIEYDGMFAVARARSQHRAYNTALQEMPDNMMDAALSLMRSIDTRIVRRQPEKMLDNDTLQYNITVTQSVNMARYSTTLKGLDRNFRDLNAEINKNNYNLSKNSIVLVDIDGRSTMYTFTDEAFESVRALYAYINAVNAVTDNGYLLSFLDENKNSVSEKKHTNRNRYFIFNDYSGGGDSYVISPKISGNYENVLLTGSIDAQELVKTSFLVVSASVYEPERGEIIYADNQQQPSADNQQQPSTNNQQQPSANNQQQQSTNNQQQPSANDQEQQSAYDQVYAASGMSGSANYAPMAGSQSSSEAPSRHTPSFWELNIGVGFSNVPMPNTLLDSYMDDSVGISYSIETNVYFSRYLGVGFHLGGLVLPESGVTYTGSYYNGSYYTGYYHNGSYYRSDTTAAETDNKTYGLTDFRVGVKILGRIPINNFSIVAGVGIYSNKLSYDSSIYEEDSVSGTAYSYELGFTQTFFGVMLWYARYIHFSVPEAELVIARQRVNIMNEYGVVEFGFGFAY